MPRCVTAPPLSSRNSVAPREFIAEEGALRDSFAASAGRLVGLAPRLVAGATTSEATATLTSLIVAAAGRDRVRIGRIEPLPDSSSALFVRIALHVEAQGDVQGIAHWLAILEGGRPAVTIQELGLSTAEPGASADKAEVLRGTLIAVGWATLRPREQP